MNDLIDSLREQYAELADYDFEDTTREERALWDHVITLCDKVEELQEQVEVYRMLFYNNRR